MGHEGDGETVMMSGERPRDVASAMACDVRLCRKVCDLGLSQCLCGDSFQGSTAALPVALPRVGGRTTHDYVVKSVAAEGAQNVDERLEEGYGFAGEGENGSKVETAHGVLLLDVFLYGGVVVHKRQ